MTRKAGASGDWFIVGRRLSNLGLLIRRPDPPRYSRPRAQPNQTNSTHSSTEATT
jgi:hypothetical protein